MIVETSAIVAVLLGEDAAVAVEAAMDADIALKMSAVAVYEASIVLHAKRGEAGVKELDDALSRLSVEIVPFTGSDARAARDAYRRWGKGNHPAGLNFGDCFAYALAKITGEPLLCTGDDFAKTDLALVAIQ